MSQPLYEKYALPCPACHGRVFRHINFFSRFIYLTPLHFFRKAEFRCTRCRADFEAQHTLSDHFLMLAFTLLAFVPNHGLATYLFCLLVWSLLSVGMQYWKADGPIEVYLACITLAIAVAVSVNNVAPGRKPTHAETALFAGLIIVGYLSAQGLIMLDHRFRPALARRP